MKKHVPDPPPVLCINPGVTHDEAVRNAADFLKKALDKTSLLPQPPMENHQDLLSDALLEMQICKAYLQIALAGSAVSTPIL